jgi:probable F420-dependent oxidoreductase
MQSKAQSRHAAALDLGLVGIWSVQVRFQPPEIGAAAAAEIEQLGFKTLWIPGGIDSGVLGDLDRLLDATPKLKFGTGILNIWKHEPADVAAWWKAESPGRQARLLLGVGVSHGPLIGEAYQSPLAKMRWFLDGALGAGMPGDRICIAALGPKMLQLAAERTAGSHPYLVTPEHTAIARKTMGPDALLAPEQGVVLERDPGKARTIARAAVSSYLRLPNYVNNWKRDGFNDDEITQMTDRFIDHVVAWGDVKTIGERVQAHLDAGADHVCLQVLQGGMGEGDIATERAAWRELAGLL